MYEEDGMSVEEELAAAKERIEELVTMLNNEAVDRKFVIENERDACERLLQAMLDDAEKMVEAGFVDALQRAIEAVKARQDPSVKWVQEMANGTVLGAFVEKMVEQAVEQAKERWDAEHKCHG